MLVMVPISLLVVLAALQIRAKRFLTRSLPSPLYHATSKFPFPSSFFLSKTPASELRAVAVVPWQAFLDKKIAAFPKKGSP